MRALIRSGGLPATVPVVDNPPIVPAGTVYFVRHGLVHNPRREMYGWLPRFRLAGAGRDQAEAAGLYLESAEVAFILVSPLLRAIQTARAISAHLPGVPVRRCPLLIESGLARHWQGNLWDELPSKHPEAHQVWRDSAGALELGESMAAMARRMQAAMALALRLSGGAPAVCVSHRDPILALRLAVEGRSFDELHSTPSNPGSITTIVSDGRTLRLAGYIEPTVVAEGSA